MLPIIIACLLNVSFHLVTYQFKYLYILWNFKKFVKLFRLCMHGSLHYLQNELITDFEILQFILFKATFIFNEDQKYILIVLTRHKDIYFVKIDLQNKRSSCIETKMISERHFGYNTQTKTILKQIDQYFILCYFVRDKNIEYDFNLCGFMFIRYVDGIFRFNLGEMIMMIINDKNLLIRNLFDQNLITINTSGKDQLTNNSILPIKVSIDIDKFQHQDDPSINIEY